MNVSGTDNKGKTGKEYGAKIKAFKGTAEALTALAQGNCLAFVYDDSFIAAKLQETQWADFEMPLPTIDDAPWGLAVQLGEDKFHGMMSEMIVEWHKSGRILELEKKYGLQNTPFALRMHDEHK